MNNYPKTKQNTVKNNSNQETASWNRQRSSQELAEFVLRKLAALETVSID